MYEEFEFLSGRREREKLGFLNFNLNYYWYKYKKCSVLNFRKIALKMKNLTFFEWRGEEGKRGPSFLKFNLNY